ncbi:MAG: biotin--[acetyl-CoA-carboxylase] ligase [Bacteroidetes bacterium]|nr:biotin--[acetyl-CoA-carboxylase] ligase [Bacteroidota bacterium]
MKTIFIGKNCIKLEKIHSTNSYLSDLTAEKNLPEGTAVIADEQEQGRGQRGTNWQSEAGKNLTLSILLKPTFLKPDEQFILSKTISLGVLDFIFSINHQPLTINHLKIKWPNDIYIGNKKVAGILIENSVSGNYLSHSIVGIGINVNQGKFLAELPNPTSLKLISGKNFDLENCLVELYSCVEKRYLQLRPHPQPLSHRRGEIDSDYLKNLYRLNEWADYNYKGETIMAKITGISKIGKLILETENKNLECDFKEVEFVL